jgi:uncharacterized protein (DUF302 family)
MTRVLISVREAFTIASALLTLTAAARGQGTMLNAPGVVTVVSASSFDSTVARLERAAVANGLTVAAKVDHAAAARKAGLTLRPTTLIIAGNPAAGTPLMLADPTIAVELPLRFLVWQGEDGKAHVSYEPIKSIAARHKLTGHDQLLTKMTGAIELIVNAATKP